MGKAQADSLKQANKDVMTYKINDLQDIQSEQFIEMKSSDLKKGDLVYVVSGQQIPADGDVIEGAALGR